MEHGCVPGKLCLQKQGGELDLALGRNPLTHDLNKCLYFSLEGNRPTKRTSAQGS